MSVFVTTKLLLTHDGLKSTCAGYFERVDQMSIEHCEQFVPLVTTYALVLIELPQ